MRAKTHSILVVASLVGLSGCGGLSLNTTGTGGNPSNSVRQNQSGDVFTYTVGGTYSQTNGVQNAALSGTTTETFVSTTYAGQAALNDTATTTFTNGVPANLIDEKMISSAGVVLGQSDNAVLQTVSSGGFTLPVTLALGTNLTGSETLANGTTVGLQLVVTGSTSVVAAGVTYACWIVSKTLTFSDGLTSTQTIEFAPSLGAAVESTIVNTFTNGLTENLTLTLSAAPTIG